MARSSLSTGSRADALSDARFQRFAAGEGPVSDAVDAVLDAAVDTARNVADALLRQVTALLLLASMLVGEVIALIPLLTDDRGSTSAKPVMAAIVAGFAGVALCRHHGIEIRVPARLTHARHDRARADAPPRRRCLARRE